MKDLILQKAEESILNIHPKTKNIEVREKFQKFGTVREVYMSRKIKQNTNLLSGFVGMGSRKEVLEAPRKMKGHDMNGEKLFVKWARFGKAMARYDQKRKTLYGREKSNGFRAENMILKVAEKKSPQRKEASEMIERIRR